MTWFETLALLLLFFILMALLGVLKLLALLVAARSRETINYTEVRTAVCDGILDAEKEGRREIVGDLYFPHKG